VVSEVLVHGSHLAFNYLTPIVVTNASKDVDLAFLKLREHIGRVGSEINHVLFVQWQRQIGTRSRIRPDLLVSFSKPMDILPPCICAIGIPLKFGLGIPVQLRANNLCELDLSSPIRRIYIGELVA
jgi:hypothetical protein